MQMMYLKCGDIGQECEVFRSVFHLTATEIIGFSYFYVLLSNTTKVSAFLTGVILLTLNIIVNYMKIIDIK
jgi:hypothetical protein